MSFSDKHAAMFSAKHKNVGKTFGERKQVL